MAPTISVSFIFSGLIDYWGGDGKRWDDNSGCLFASFDPHTTLRQIVNELADDFVNGECSDKDAFADVSRDDVKNAILESLTPEGLRDFKRGRLSEFAKQLDKKDYKKDSSGCYDGELPQIVFMLTVEVPEPEETEPAEDDITTTDHKNFYQNGKLVLQRTIRRDGEPLDSWYGDVPNGPTLHSLIGNFGDDCEAALRAYMEKTQFWPTVWFISDHGNAHIMKL